MLETGANELCDEMLLTVGAHFGIDVQTPNLFRVSDIFKKILLFLQTINLYLNQNLKTLLIP